MTQVVAERLTPEAFRAYGDVVNFSGAPDLAVAGGAITCFLDRVKMEFPDGRPSLSLLIAEPTRLPMSISMMERHPFGSQTFIPMAPTQLIVVVAKNGGNRPKNIRAFLAEPNQVISFHRGTWHAAVSPFPDVGQFAVIDRVGAGTNLEEFRLDQPFTVICD